MRAIKGKGKKESNKITPENLRRMRELEKEIEKVKGTKAALPLVQEYRRLSSPKANVKAYSMESQLGIGG